MISIFKILFFSTFNALTRVTPRVIDPSVTGSTVKKNSYVKFFFVGLTDFVPVFVGLYAKSFFKNSIQLILKFKLKKVTG